MTPDSDLTFAVCPKCGDRIERIPRRIIDYLFGLFRPALRYRCRTNICLWEGNLPVKRTPS